MGKKNEALKAIAVGKLKVEFAPFLDI
jgi:hypothetical protein